MIIAILFLTLIVTTFFGVFNMLKQIKNLPDEN
jgi:hypothetical protein